MVINSAKDLASFIKNYRKKLNLSQTELGEQVGLKQNTISRLELNPEGVKISTLFRTLAAAGLEIDIKPKPTNQQNWNEDW